jgi:hypothetical protein
VRACYLHSSAQSAPPLLWIRTQFQVHQLQRLNLMRRVRGSLGVEFTHDYGEEHMKGLRQSPTTRRGSIGVSFHSYLSLQMRKCKMGSFVLPRTMYLLQLTSSFYVRRPSCPQPATSRNPHSSKPQPTSTSQLTEFDYLLSLTPLASVKLGMNMWIR